MEKYILSIQNFSNIITNSSSELFVLQTSDSADVIYNIIKNHAKDNKPEFHSGDAGRIDVETVTQSFERCLPFGIYDEENNHWHTMEDTGLSRLQLLDVYKSNWGPDKITLNDNDLIISIDWAYQDTITEIIKGKLCATRIE